MDDIVYYSKCCKSLMTKKDAVLSICPDCLEYCEKMTEAEYEKSIGIYSYFEDSWLNQDETTFNQIEIPFKDENIQESDF